MILDVIPLIRPTCAARAALSAIATRLNVFTGADQPHHRLKKLLYLNAPEVIIRNEKRTLQQSVDPLSTTSAAPPVLDRQPPLTSLTDISKGTGPFPRELLCKRVDLVSLP